MHFEWDHSGNLSNITTAQTLSSTGSFNEPVLGFDSDTEYEYRAVVEASDSDVATDDTVAFTTHIPPARTC